LGTDERPEDLGQLAGRDADAVVEHQDAHPVTLALESCADGHLGTLALLDGVQGIADDIEQSSMEPFGVRGNQRQAVRQARLEPDAAFLEAALEQLQNIANNAIDIRVLDSRLALLGI